MILRIAVPRPLYTLLDYRCPDDLQAQIGCRVRVPLGRSVTTGIIVEITDKSEFKKLRKVLAVLDREPLLEKSSLALLYWASQYYHHPIGDVIFNAIPAPLRKGKALPQIVVWQVNSSMSARADELLGRAHKQRQLWAFLNTIKNDGWISESQLKDHLEGEGIASWRNLLKTLAKKELIISKKISATLPLLSNKPLPDKKINLTTEQQEVLLQLDAFYQEETIKPVLLHGITGSGKTEIYLRTIEAILQAGKQALILVPEIGLTPQLFSRFQQYFPQYKVTAIHSALSDGERTLAWQAAKRAEVDIIIGTRSAVFSPLANLGIIIVDEEHDGSFKQQEGFRYHGRDLAIKRAFDLGIPVILGSATPALESLQNVERKRYHYLRLNSRPGSRSRPDMLVQDIRGIVLEAGVSSLLMKEIKQHIDAGNQTMLFLNRRGFAPVLYCPSCGWHALCPSCDVNMTYHASRRKTICHHCSYEEAVTNKCPSCDHTGITTQGQGTERIEQVLLSHFPETPVIRIDRDTTSRKGSLDSKLAVVRQGKPVILIGTQMLTKGHDFPNLTLVGILDVDQSLFSMDYRAQEQLAQQIIQVSGRAGRGDKKGRVLLQTSQPEHPLLTNLLGKGYLNIAKQLLSERRTWHYPPFGFQVLIRVSALDKEQGLRFLHQLNSELSATLDQQTDVSLLGPVPSPMEKRANRYRCQLLINASNRSSLHRTLAIAITKLQVYKKPSNIKWSVDVDPLNML